MHLARQADAGDIRHRGRVALRELVERREAGVPPGFRVLLGPARRRSLHGERPLRLGDHGCGRGIVRHRDENRLHRRRAEIDTEYVHGARLCHGRLSRRKIWVGTGGGR